MLERRFPQGKNIKTNFIKLIMIKMITPVKDEGRLSHCLMNFLVIQFPVFIPLSDKSKRVCTIGSFVYVLNK